jgi:hypothetical protein
MQTQPPMAPFLVPILKTRSQTHDGGRPRTKTPARAPAGGRLHRGAELCKGALFPSQRWQGSISRKH